MKKQSILQIILIIIFIVVLSFFSSIIYLNKIYIPHKLKPLLAKKISERIDRKVKIQSISYNFPNGFVVKNFKIIDKTPDNDKSFLDAKRIEFNVLLLPILKSKQLVIPTIYIYSPEVNIKFTSDKKFNIPFPEKTKVTSSKKIKVKDIHVNKLQVPKMQFAVSSIIVKNGEFKFQDQSKTPYFKKTMENVNMAINLSIPESIGFTLNASVNSDSNILLEGKYKPQNESFNANAEIKNILITEYTPYLKTLPMSVTSGNAKGIKLIISGNKGTVNCRYNFATEHIILKKDNYEFSGIPEVNGNIDFDLSEETKIDYNGSIKLQNATLEGIPKIKNLNNIKGKLNFSKDNLKTDSLTSDTLDSSLEIKGELNDFNNPKIEISISGFDDLKAKTKFNIHDKNISVTQFSGNYRNSKLDFNGNINLENNNIMLENSNGNISLDLTDIKEIGKKFDKKFKTSDLKGTFTGSFSANGIASNVHNLNIILNGNSNQILFKKIKLTNVVLRYEKKQEKAKLILDSKAYNGNLKMDTDLMFKEENINYYSDITVKNLNLLHLKKDTALKDKKISGKLNFTASAKGSVKDLPELTGNAKVNVTDGNLLELDLLKGITKILSLPSSERITFQKATGDLIFKKDKVYTKKFKFISNQIEFIFIGNFDFAGNIDFDVLTTFSEKFDMIGLNEIETVVSTIFQKTQRFVALEVAGTFKKPKYNIIPTPQKIFKGLFGLF